ncbi:MAG: hypothetical protein LBK66_12300 [Spirochaetaceae bacterium]|jgi:uncharacterized membrane protein YcgQ (UPF0703/DUF1980 family)|nr:hypothetical protein [Spirochaetaceae bacterium]
MKKNMGLLAFIALFMLGIPACEHKTVQAETVKAEQSAETGQRIVKENAEAKAAKAEQPVIEIKEKLFIAQTNDIYLNPEDYMGRKIKLEGLFKTDSYVGSDKSYCFVLRYGPGCCGFDGTAGFEVSWPKSGNAYPVDNDWVEAVGVLDSYDEDGYPYVYLALESLKVMDERGAETVKQ